MLEGAEGSAGGGFGISEGGGEVGEADVDGRSGNTGNRDAGDAGRRIDIKSKCGGGGGEEAVTGAPLEGVDAGAGRSVSEMGDILGGDDLTRGNGNAAQGEDAVGGERGDGDGCEAIFGVEVREDGREIGKSEGFGGATGFGFGAVSESRGIIDDQSKSSIGGGEESVV